MSNEESELLQLPSEILRAILGLVVDRDNWHWFPGTYSEPERRATVLRLVCRGFHDASSHLFFQYVHLGINMSSLRRLEEIMHHPLISKGVQAIHINLAYHASELVGEIQKFKRQCLSKLLTLWKNLDNAIVEKSEQSASSKRNVLGNLVKHRDYVKSLHKTWMEFADTDEMILDRRYTDDIQLLVDTHAEYTARYHEQEHLLQNDSFLHILTSILRKHNIIKVQFHGNAPRKSNIKPFYDSDIVRDRQRLIDYVSATHSWYIARYSGYTPAPSKISLLLPMFFNDQNIKLRCFEYHDLAIYLLDHKWTRQQFPRFKEAFSSLEIIHIGTDSAHKWNGMRASHAITLIQYSVLKDVVLTMMSSSKIREATISIPFVQDKSSTLNLQSVFSVTIPKACPSLEKLKLMGVTFHAQEVIAFITSPQNGRLKNFTLYQCRITRGKWRDVVVKMRRRAREIKFAVCAPSGGEMLPLTDGLPTAYYQETPPSIKDYLDGLTDQNPFELEQGKLNAV